MSKLIAAIRLMRLYYSGPMAGTFSLTAWYATGDAPRLAELLLATLAVGALIAAGYVLNDVIDAKLDAAAGKRGPVATGAVSPRAAGWLAAGLFLVSLALAGGVSLVQGRGEFVFVVAAVAVALAGYDRFSKSIGGFKQLAVAALMVSLYAMAWGFAGGFSGSRGRALWWFAGWVFASSWAYEVYKDVRDAPGDRAFAGRANALQRLPGRFLTMARGLVLLGAACLIGPVFAGCGWVYAVGLALPVGAAAVASTRREPAGAIRWIYIEFCLVGIIAAADVIVCGF